MKPTKAQSEALVRMARRMKQASPRSYREGMVGKHHRLYAMFGSDVMDALIGGGMLQTRTDYLLGGAMSIHLTSDGRAHIENLLYPVTDLRLECA